MADEDESSSGHQRSTSLLNFAIAWPGEDLLISHKQMSGAVNRVLQGRIFPEAMNYGEIQGYWEARVALLDFLMLNSGWKVDAHDVFLCNGVSQGLDLVARQLSKPDAVCIIEEYTYDLAPPIFEQYGFSIQTTPVLAMQDDLLSDLTNLLRTAAVDVIYVIPTFHNPTGLTMNEVQRIRLLDLAAEFKFKIVADEIYTPLNFNVRKTYPLLLQTRTTEHARKKVLKNQLITLGSVSKFAGPGLRIGWIISRNERFIESIVDLPQFTSGGGVNTFMIYVLHSLLDSGTLRAHRRKTQKTLKKRCETLSGLLRAYDEGIDKRLLLEFKIPEGGYYLWGKLPMEIPFKACPVPVVAKGKYVRICFAHLPFGLMQEAVMEFFKYVYKELETAGFGSAFDQHESI